MPYLNFKKKDISIEELIVLSVLKLICKKDYKINQQHLKKAFLVVPLIDISIKKTKWDTKFIGMSIKIIKINTKSRASCPLHAHGFPTYFP